MSQLYGPFNAGTGANFDETQWREFFGNLITAGVLKGAKVNGSAGGDLAITAPGGAMSVNLATGCAAVYGFGYENTATLAVTIGAADATLKRIDVVCIKFDFSARTVQVAVHVGTLAASPVAPALTQNATTWEVPLSQVFVSNGVTQITSGNLTDVRAYAASIINPSTQGSGSGLNADLLDGLDSTAFAPLASPVFTGTPKVGANTIWHAGNDGSGSGLDADTVDGVHASALAPLAGPALTGTPTINGNTIWHAGNDGTGSGLDADSLDGIGSSGFALVGTHNTISPLKISAGTALPGTLDSREIFILLT